jgi:flagellar protein FliS
MHGRYLENEVLSADPIGLVQLLYAGAIDAIRKARVFLQEGDIHGRSATIVKAMQIILELQSSLDLERGGEIAVNLARLYAYIQERLAEANARQALAPLDEVLQLLLILNEGWEQAARQSMAAPPAEALGAAGPANWTL